MSVTVRVAVRLAALVLVAVPLAACGSDGTSDTDASSAEDTSSVSPSESPTDSPSADEPAEGPDCASVWQEGAELPRGYAGCVDEGGELVPVEKVGCSSGQALLMYDDMYWGAAGGTVYMGTAPLAEDPDFLAAVRRCRA